MSRVVLNQAAVKKFGQRNAAIAVKAVQLPTAAGSKRMAPRSPAHLSGSRKPKPGKRLSESIRVTPLKFTAWRVEGRVEALSPIAMSIHQGAKPHRIAARRKKALKFYWTRAVARDFGRRRIRPGQASFFKHVQHPGIRRPVRFLTTPLAAAARANNFLYRSTR